MASIGKLPENISLLHALDSIGENIIVADVNYNIAWMNSHATELFSKVITLFDIPDLQDLLGLNMGRFHRDPNYQKKIMDELTEVHRARINIRNRLVADIVITPIKTEAEKIEGYIVMLLDVTTKAEEEKKKDNLIKGLSVPIMYIWEKTIALPLIGDFTQERGESMISSVLKESSSNDIDYVLVSLGGLNKFDDGVQSSIKTLNDCLQLMGIECILVGITPKIAMTFGENNKQMRTISTSHEALKYIIKKQSRETDIAKST
ncbi:RsbR, positive regulator of sigma-B [Salipaludibacillus sp. CF4.18]|uniref:STAS domain-containing protein n=1 Tax=Salipaludibacillus sp. CF4.18 TaxID=3373081 RepID=UPI003EE77884